MYNIACSFQVKRMIVQKIKMVATGSLLDEIKSYKISYMKCSDNE